MKPKPQAKMEKSPDAYLRRAMSLIGCAPAASDEEIEAAIREYGKAVLRAAGPRKSKSS